MTSNSTQPPTPATPVAKDSAEAIDWIDRRERLVLAPFAMHSRDSLGRIHPEQEHLYRGPFQRDRDRILHSWAYRRLSGKMQVFTGEMGDYHRTRLTHTQEVATTARTIGRALGLNEDLIEALALMHDIGHPPYGHAGEDVLNECAADHGGFSHNQFALTIVQELEIVYPQFTGLNLTMEVLAGQNFRADKANVDLDRLLEVQLVDAADSTAYDAHDTDDALKLGLVSIDQMAQLGLIKTCLKHVAKKHTALDKSLQRTALVHQLIELQVTQLTAHCAGELRKHGFANAFEAMSSNFLIEQPAELAEQKRELEAFLYQNVYRHPQLITIRETAQNRLKQMYAAFCENPELFPRKYQRRADLIGVPRMAVEYLAGMTDRFCEQTYDQIGLGD
ncbi:dNTP triphosphohydrolase [Mariniblastus sp.]|nr:dNTP triphosphohydrolase [Mariniblastus sp.]